MENSSHQQQPSQDFATSLLFDKLLDYRNRYGILGAARPPNATELHRIEEAKNAIQCLGLPSHLRPVPIIDKASLETLVSKTLNNPFGVTLQSADYLKRYAYYFFFVPLRVESEGFSEAEISLRSDFEQDPQTQEPPQFFELFPRTEVQDIAKFEEAFEIGVNAQMKLSASSPQSLNIAEGTKISGNADTGATLKTKFTQGLSKVWKDTLIRASVPPDTVANWKFRSRDKLSHDKPCIAFILQIPKGMRRASLSYEIKLRFSSPPWERVVARWLESLRALWTDLSPEEQRHICLLEGYVRDGLWSAYYSEKPLMWEFDEQDLRR